MRPFTYNRLTLWSGYKLGTLPFSPIHLLLQGGYVLGPCPVSLNRLTSLEWIPFWYASLLFESFNFFGVDPILICLLLRLVGLIPGPD